MAATTRLDMRSSLCLDGRSGEMLSVRSATDFPKVFQLALFVCVPRLCTQCNYVGTVVTEASVSVTFKLTGRAVAQLRHHPRQHPSQYAVPHHHPNRCKPQLSNRRLLLAAALTLLWRRSSLGRRAHRVELRLLLVAQRGVEVAEVRANRLDGIRHRV